MKLLVLATILISQVSFAQHEGGTNVGGTLDSIVIFKGDSGRKASLAAYEKGAFERYAAGNKLLAIDILRSGLASSVLVLPRNSFEHKFTERALELSASLSSIPNSIDLTFSHLSFVYQALQLPNADYRQILKTWFNQTMTTPLKSGTILPNYSKRIFTITLSSLCEGLAADLKLAKASGNDGVSLSEIASELKSLLAGDESDPRYDSTLQAAYQTFIQTLDRK